MEELVEPPEFFEAWIVKPAEGEELEVGRLDFEALVSASLGFLVQYERLATELMATRLREALGTAPKKALAAMVDEV